MKAKRLVNLLVLIALTISGTTVQANSNNPNGHKNQEAVFAAGWFWGVEADFLDTPGVVATEVGYTGGRTSNPNYEQVCSGNTGHAEAVHVTYDPQKISFKKLVERFLRIHNPRYDNSHVRGGQYRSEIFYYSPEQALVARQVISEQEKMDKTKFYTQVSKAVPFYRAEEYHQKYNQKNNGAFCGGWFKKK